MALAVAAFQQGDDQAKRFATIERLQTAGANAAVAGACTIVGYEPDQDGINAYWAEEGRFAQADGMFIEQAISYLELGMKGRSEAILNEMKHHRRLLEAGDKGADALSQKFVRQLVEDCDLLASRSETRAMFDYVPANAGVATSAGYKRLGLTK